MTLGISHFRSNLVGLTGNEYVEIDGNRFNATYGVELAASHLLWDDLRVPMSSVKTGASKNPGFSNVKNGLYCYVFDSD